VIPREAGNVGNEQVEAEGTFRRLEHWGVRVIGVGDGYDSYATSRTNKAVVPADQGKTRTQWTLYRFAST
jgi:hypothetical protein